MVEMNYCMHCMEKMEDGEMVCSKCGHVEGKENTPSFALAPSTILKGKYLVGMMMGQGGFGITYIGFDLVLQKKVAIKEYYPQSLSSRSKGSTIITWFNHKDHTTGCENFLDEARNMAKLTKINSVATVYDMFYENNTAYIVMDFIEGETLKDKIKREGPMTYAACIKLLEPIMEGLEQVHQDGFIHRDIKPDNIMIQPDGKAMLLDLGAARKLNSRGNNANIKSGLVVTNGYSPLEQYMDAGEVGPWSDVYAMTATVIYTVTGKDPKNALERLSEKSDNELIIEDPDNHIPKDKLAALKKGMALKKKDRYQTVSELRAALKISVNKKLVAGISGVIVAAAVVIGAYVMTPWEPEVKEFGCPNTNLNVESDYQMIDGQYEYYLDNEWNMYVVPYNQEDQTFYIDRGTVVDDEAASINVGNTKVYFIHDEHDEDGDHDSILQMDLDGSNTEKVIDQDGLLRMQYVQLSNGKEYLYYTLKTDEDNVYELYRYNIESGEKELVKDEIYWFNMYGKYLYYVTFDGQNPYDYTALHRSFLDGGRDSVLNDTDCLLDGYVVDGKIYMTSLNQEVMVQVDESKKNHVEIVGGDYSKDIYSGTSVFGDGWFYYCSNNSTEINRVMADGTGKETVTKAGQNVFRLNYVNKWLLVAEGEYNSEKGEYDISSFTLLFNDGSISMSLGTPSKEGLTYTIENGEAYITGYTGEKDRVAVPMSINGYPLNFSNMDDSLNNVQFYLEIPEDELTYKKVDGGICITGYNPNVSNDQDNLAVPSEIDGQPVIEIGANAFSNEDKAESEQYTFSGMLLPDTIQLIDRYAFYDCSNLVYINIPSDLKKLNKLAFAYCPLTDLEIIFPEGMQSIGAMVFTNAEIKSVYLPDSLEILGDNPFVGCGKDSENAENIFLVDDNSKTFCVENGVLYNADKTILYSVQAYTSGVLTIPDTVTKICSMALCKTDYSLITVPSSVTEYNMAFFSCNVELVALVKGITEIPEGAFSYCKKLTTISIPDTVKKIDSQAFAGCESLTRVSISKSCVVADDAFDVNTSVTKK